ncbi:MAG: PIN domain-containing protein [Bifidobacteriaceae bacterium]|nr:PIN domain-containing protein [Bifidobacteriaceae bacterium]
MEAVADTSIVIALENASEPNPDLTGIVVAVSTLTWSEMAVGLHTATGVVELGRRLRALQDLRESLPQTLPYDDACVAAYHRVLDRVLERGGKPKARQFDRMIAATALAHGLPLVTRDMADARLLDGLVEILER